MVWVVWNTETANQTVGVNSQILRPQNTWRPQHLHHHRWLAHQHPCRIPISSILPGMLGSPKGDHEKKNRRGSEITAWKIPWRWMDDNWFRNVFSDGLKDNQLSLDQLGRISILTFSVVWVLKGDADRIWRHTGHFFSELGLVQFLQFSKQSVAESYHRIFFSMVVSFGHPKIDVKS